MALTPVYTRVLVVSACSRDLFCECVLSQTLWLADGS